MTEKKTCYCTLITSDSYVVGAQALILSCLSHAKIERPFVVLHLSTVSKFSLKVLSKIPTVQLRQIEEINGPQAAKRTVETWQDYTKLRIWTLIDFDYVVYLDADTLVMENIEDLFERDLGQLGFAAAPDVFPPDKFNAGCLVIHPDVDVFEKMVSQVTSLSSYDGGDTGFLNAFFPDWYIAPSSNRLPFAYNAQRTMFWMTQAQPGYWSVVKPKIIHFSSSPKPWLTVDKKGELEMLWWTTYTELLAASRKAKQSG